MIKNVIIVSLIVLVCAFGYLGVYEHNELVNTEEILNYERTNRRILEDHIQEAGIYLYNALGNSEYVDDLMWMDSKSLCTDELCVNVDWNGDIFVTEFYKE